MRRILSCMLCLAFAGLMAQPLELKRGPYLQFGTPSSMIIKWRTNTSAIGKVYYGTSLSSLTSVVAETGPATDHLVKVQGLQPFTKYFYKVETNDTLLTTVDSTFHFITNPAQGVEKPIHIWAIGDFGKANQGQKDVRDTYLQRKGNGYTDVWLWLGDNAYYNGTEEEFQTEVFDIYPTIFRNTVVRPSPGNHDYGAMSALGVAHDSIPYYKIANVPTNGELGGEPSGVPHYYSYDYAGVHFISLNTEWLAYLSSDSTPMLKWLAKDLAGTTAKWKIAYFHKPPYTKGSHDSDSWFDALQLGREKMIPVLEAYGVDLVLNGHSHCYERSFLLKGHFGKSSTFDDSMKINKTNGNEAQGTPYYKYVNGPKAGFGTVYAVMGSSGSLSSDGDLNHPAHVIGDKTRCGSLMIDIDNNRLHAQMITDQNNVFDDFTILKVDSTYTGISSVAIEENYLRVYPNPTSINCYAEFSTTASSSVQVTLTDITGKDIWSRKEKTTAHELSKVEIPLKRVSAGTYLVTLRTPSGKPVTKEIIVQQ
jgi:hypothetical protein